MGLGKTVQVIAMMCHLIATQGAGPPFLIAAPASVLPNWAAELARWAPKLRVRNCVWCVVVWCQGGKFTANVIKLGRQGELARCAHKLWLTLAAAAMLHAFVFS